MRDARADVLRLYHGTTVESAASIERDGLHAAMMTAGWYTLASDRESAVFHSYGALVTFEIPVGDRKGWPGFPYLWKASEREKGSLWYALREVVPARFVVKVERVTPRDVARAKTRGLGERGK